MPFIVVAGCVRSSLLCRSRSTKLTAHSNQFFKMMHKDYCPNRLRDPWRPNCESWCRSGLWPALVHRLWVAASGRAVVPMPVVPSSSIWSRCHLDHLSQWTLLSNLILEAIRYSSHYHSTFFGVDFLKLVSALGRLCSFRAYILSLFPFPCFCYPFILPYIPSPLHPVHHSVFGHVSWCIWLFALYLIRQPGPRLILSKPLFRGTWIGCIWRVLA